MDFTKFVSMLESRSLYFPRADKLEDPFEGSLTAEQVGHRKDSLEGYPNEWIEELLPKFRRICTRHTFLNCWHMNDGESAAMWDLYLKADQGICIESTYESLIESIDDEQDIFVSKIQYIDYESRIPPGWGADGHIGDTITPFTHKRTSYEHEQELRAIIHDLPWHSEEGEREITPDEIRSSDLDESAYEPGRSVNVDLSELIEGIHVSPESDKWIRDLLVDVCEKYEIDPDLVAQSKIGENPSF
ncbi:hypothetical protein [Halobaculum lipolyticum]|uniref:DUF2971 domain-containing protein n=2 Tax=Halobaculum lipolyticum TaxID=3032001 RepID=A0ABD5WFA1_9EURY|nr:hypothetical protein [Halobaculum sp. DT31]